MTPEPTIKLQLRLPPTLHKQATRRAAQEERSLNSLLIIALKRYLEAQ